MPPYDSLNLSLDVSDEEATVLDNRRRLADALGIDPARLTFAEQVHGARIVRVDHMQIGAGASPNGRPRERADALISDIPDVPLVILTADCLPIILADTRRKIVAAVHAGWRGVFEKIAAKAVEAMIVAGSEPANIEARFGPHIKPCCFEVGADVYDRFAEKFFLPPAVEKPRLDLSGLSRSALIESGVRPESIRTIDYCTHDNRDLFYSWRRDGVTGRQAAVAALLPQ